MPCAGTGLAEHWMAVNVRGVMRKMVLVVMTSEDRGVVEVGVVVIDDATQEVLDELCGQGAVEVRALVQPVP